MKQNGTDRVHGVREGEVDQKSRARGSASMPTSENLFHVPRVNNPNEWLTPPEIVKELGPFDLDPASPITRPWPTAAKHYTIADNGLTQPWEGRVWLNPPYGREIEPFMRRMAAHRCGIALVFTRTDMRWFQDCVFKAAKALFFTRGRIAFHLPNGISNGATSNCGSVLVAYTSRDADRLASFMAVEGTLVTL